MIINFQEASINTGHPTCSGITYTYTLGNETDGKAYGAIDFNLFETDAIVHPKLFTASTEAFKKLKEELYSIGVPLMKKWGYERVLIHTSNKKMCDMLSDGKAEKIGEAGPSNWPIYAFNLEEN